ncbi:MAG: hypothetical protein WC159_05525 [Sphaerochaetaceae bacterium]
MEQWPSAEHNNDNIKKDETLDYDRTFKLEEEFKTVWEALTEEEKKVLMYAELEWSGYEDEKLNNQDELLKSATEKLTKAGFNMDDLGALLSVQKKRD